MIIGYSFVPAAADTESLERLCKGLSDAGAHVVFIDQPRPIDPDVPESGFLAGLHPAAMTDNPRPQLDAALAMASRGDVLLAFTPVHLARTATDLVQIADRLTAQGATLRILRVAGRQQLDTATPGGAVMLATIGVLAAFERAAPGADAQAMMLSTSLLQTPLAAGDTPLLRRPRGRPPTASAMTPEINEMRASGMGATEIARRLKICRSSVYRILQTGGVPAEPASQPAPRPSPARLSPAPIVGWSRPGMASTMVAS
jgi:DNA invertase Pin-like site-specific DNA recombinase